MAFATYEAAHSTIADVDILVALVPAADPLDEIIEVRRTIIYRGKREWVRTTLLKSIAEWECANGSIHTETLMKVSPTMIADFDETEPGVVTAGDLVGLRREETRDE